MTTETRASETPATPSTLFARTPLWARIAAPLLVIAGGAALVGGIAGAGAPPATVESLCRSAIEATLASRGHTDVDVARTMRVTDADGAERVSGSVTSVDEAGRVDYAELRCVVRGTGDAMRVVSARVSD